MKQYLKMKDVFADSAKKGTNLVCGKTLVAKFVDGVECEYSVHAINSHDELVQMNQELLAALDDITKIKWRDGLAGIDRPTDFAERESAIRALGSAMIIARSAISKAKGGAA